MKPEWKKAYAAGMFTEFQEQRAPGHTVLGDKIYRKGMLDIKNDIRENIEKLDFINDPRAYQKREELNGMSIAADAIIRFGERHSGEALRWSWSGTLRASSRARGEQPFSFSATRHPHYEGE